MLYDFLISQNLANLYVYSILLIVTILIMLVAAPAIAAFLCISNLDYDLDGGQSSATRKMFLSLLALCLTAVSIASLFLVGTITLNLVRTGEIVDQSIEQVYDVTKTGNRLFFNRKISNSMFVEDDSTEITNENEETYTIVRNNHVHQIPRSIVTEK